jgi:hypothetical protein
MIKPLSSLIARCASAAAVAAACLASAPAVLAAADPVDSDHFAQGWQAESHAMINRGTTIRTNTPMTAWYVPANLPRGHYFVIDRKGDKAELVQGYTFDITTSAYREINVMLPVGYDHVEALPERFVSEVKSDAPRARFEGQ